MVLGLTLGETEKSIDLHKVSRGSGFAIQIQSLRENRNWGGNSNIANHAYESKQYWKLCMGKFVEQCEISYLDNILSEIHPTWEHKYTQAPKP